MVETRGGVQLLQGVDVLLKSGTVTAVCGKSGSGKTTLLRALSQQKLHGMSVSFEEGGDYLKHVHTAYLRQQDDSEGFGKLLPVDYVRFTAAILDTNSERLRDVILFCESLFDKLHSGINPFLDISIENLSGGQRRILNIATTLLVEP